MSESNFRGQPQTITLALPHVATLDGLPVDVEEIRAAHNPFVSKGGLTGADDRRMTLKTPSGSREIYGEAVIDVSGRVPVFKFFSAAEAAGGRNA